MNEWMNECYEFYYPVEKNVSPIENKDLIIDEVRYNNFKWLAVSSHLQIVFNTCANCQTFLCNSKNFKGGQNCVCRQTDGQCYSNTPPATSFSGV